MENLHFAYARIRTVCVLDSENAPFLKKNTFFTTNKNEVEVITFAVELLIPDKCIYEFKDTSVTINEVAQTYGVPEEMCNLKKIDHIK